MRAGAGRPTSPEEVSAQSVGSFHAVPPWRDRRALRSWLIASELADRLGAGLDCGVLGDLELFTPYVG